MGSPTEDLLALSDDHLAEILIRLPTLADLGRACCACPTFRRVITDHSFLRRLRALHPAPLLGILTYAFIPAEPPHPSTTAASTFADAAAADFKCSFLPSRNRWRSRGGRDGRVLLSAIGEGSGGEEFDERRTLVRDLAVCDPIHRRYLLLPAISDELAALVPQQEIVRFEPFLAPACEDDVGGNSFRVICLAQCTSKLVVFVFSSAIGQCFCWLMHWIQKMLVLDTRTMEFSSVDIPPGHPMLQRAIVEAGEGRFGIFTLGVDIVYGKRCPVHIHSLRYTVLRNAGQDPKQEQAFERIPLPTNYRYNIMGVAGGYLLLQGIPGDFILFPLSERPNLDCFSLNLKSFELEWFCETKHAILLAELYVGFPLSLSPPTI
ncbi:unnamed protein product [Urochloa decumbens]|uniref:F-box domain-containing protein n=1 Tax=Urochloa decumbens TaxID=240449 RepID=A0ABC9FD01_9POAL